MKFTDSQSQAIQSNSKKILVVAGAGSGKTLTLVERICRQISDGIDPRNILALTFSNKAATEMKNRIVKKLGTKASKIWVKTFHSFGLSIIRMYGEEIGIPKKVDIIDSSSKSLFVKEYLDNNNLTYLPEETFNTISSIKNQIIDCPDVFKDLYDEYNKYLKDNNLIDFEDMVSISLDVFKNSERAIKQVRNRFKHILVDEYQDTNYIQNKLVEIISDGNNIFFVGDDDQCIYEWRGSRPEYFRNLNNSGDFEVIYLRENFRSESSIVSMANVIINRNKNRLNKEMLPTINSNDKPEIKTFLNNVQEALFIVKEIKKELLTGVKKNEIAVLGRNIAQLDRIKYFLDMEGIEYSTIIDIHKHQFGFIKFLKNVKNLKFRSNFSAAINFPNRILDRFAYEDILEENSIISNEPYDIINEIYNKNIEFEYENPFRERYELILKISEDELSPLEIVYEYYNILQNVDKEEANDSNKNLLVELQDIKALTETFIFDNDKINLTEYIDYLQCMFEYSNENIQTNVEGINVLTCHKSKGLEYDIVFIPGLQIGNFPNDYFVTTEQEIEQERRLLYVSLTRAKKKLYITRFDNRQSIYPFEFNKDGFISELENIKYNMNNEISNIVVEEQELDEIDKEEMYKKAIITLSNLKYTHIPSHKRNKYLGRNDIIKLKKHPDVLEYLIYGEYIWRKNKVNTILPDYTPQLTYYIKNIEKLLQEIVEDYSDRKKMLGKICKIKDVNNNFLIIEGEAWKDKVTLGNLISFIKRNKQDMIIDVDKQFVLDYLYEFKNNVRNPSSHTGEVKSREDANSIRLKSLCLLKMILADIY